MGFLELLLIAIGLAMDAFAVSICKGLAMKKMNWKKACIIGGSAKNTEESSPFSLVIRIISISF